MFNGHKIIRSYIPTYGAGCSYFYPPDMLHTYYTHDRVLGPTIDSDMISPLLLCISDNIIIDKSWRTPYLLAGGENLCTVKVINFLIDNGIVTERQIVDSSKKNILSKNFTEFINAILIFYSNRYELEIDDKVIEILYDDPIEIIRMIKQQNSEYKILNAVSIIMLDILVDSFYSYCCAESTISRIHDPRNFYGVFLNVTGRIKADISKNKFVDYLVFVAGDCIPKINLFMSKDNQDAGTDSPLANYGFKSKSRPEPDELTTMKMFNEVLNFRKNDVCIELRELYVNTLNSINPNNGLECLVDNREQFHRQWALARAELRKSFKVGKRLERWTDVLTIPGAIASCIVPIAGVIPIITWFGSKAINSQSGNDSFRKFPWLSLAEHLGDFAIELKNNMKLYKKSS